MNNEELSNHIGLLIVEPVHDKEIQEVFYLE